MVLGLFGVSWVMPKSVVGLLDSWQGWQGQFVHHQNSHIWIIVSPLFNVMSLEGKIQ